MLRKSLTFSLQAARLGEVPVGAVLVCGGRILSRAHNLVERRNDPTAHAEMLVIRQVHRHLLPPLASWPSRCPKSRGC